MRIAFISLGCAKALVDTETMMGILRSHGHEITPEIEGADVVVINTCSFIESARKETEKTLKEVFSLGKRIVLAGCYVNRYREELRRRFPELLSWVSTENIWKIEEAIKGRVSHSTGLYLQDSKTPRLISTPPSWAYLKISEGCSRGCTFCAIPNIRGPYRSRTVEDIVEEAKRLEAEGRLEINIISQDTTYFGGDRGKRDIVPLIEALLSKTEKVWVRLLYLYPSEGIYELFPLFSERRLLPYFDIPLQHSNKRILRAMGRPWDGERYLELINRIRDEVEEAVIRTSLIVGFPGEGPREFEELLKWIERAKFDRLGVFTYSREEGTPAYSLGDPVSKKEKERRAAIVSELQAEISKDKNEKMVGKKLKVLIEGKTPEGVYFGRSLHFAPEVDGGIYILGEVKGQGFERVRITHAHIYDLEGETE